MKKKYDFTIQELQDIWSGLAVWQDECLNKKLNPETDKQITKLIAKVKTQIEMRLTKQSEL